MSNYKKFGKALLGLWISFIIICGVIFAFYIHLINKTTLLPESINKFIKDKQLFPFPYIFLNDTMLYLFIFFTLLIFVFSLVHGIYIFSKKKEDTYTKKSEKDILNTTMAGYCLIIGAYFILLLPMTGIFGSINDITLSISLLFGLLMIIGVVLLSVGLSNIQEKEKELKELKSASIMSPVFIAFTGIIYGIVPACCTLLKPPNSVTNISSNTVTNPLINVLKSQIKNMNDTIKQKSPEKELLNQLQLTQKITKTKL